MAHRVASDDLDLGAVGLLLTVIELGSVSKAAARRGISQPSATARIQKLERQLGALLLERGPTGSEPTELARQILPWCEELVRAAQVLAREVETVRHRSSGRLRLAASPLVAAHALMGWMATAELGGTAVSLIELDARGVASAVRERDVDLGLVDGPRPPLGLGSTVVGTWELVPVVAPHHRWAARRRPLDPAQLGGGPLIVGPRGSGTLDVIELALAPWGVGGPRIEVFSEAAVRLAAVNGEGLALAPSPLVADDLAAGRLVRVPLEGLPVEQPLRATWIGARPDHPAARSLLAAIGA